MQPYEQCMNGGMGYIVLGRNYRQEGGGNVRREAEIAKVGMQRGKIASVAVQPELKERKPSVATISSDPVTELESVICWSLVPGHSSSHLPWQEAILRTVSLGGGSLT